MVVEGLCGNLPITLVLTFVVLLTCSRTAAEESPTDECSTEKANGDCTITVDRSYPVVLPTIQMRAGMNVHVEANYIDSHLRL